MVLEQPEQLVLEQQEPELLLAAVLLERPEPELLLVAVVVQVVVAEQLQVHYLVQFFQLLAKRPQKLRIKETSLQFC